jgi:hypothetical protein
MAGRSGEIARCGRAYLKVALDEVMIALRDVRHLLNHPAD